MRFQIKRFDVPCLQVASSTSVSEATAPPSRAAGVTGKHVLCKHLSRERLASTSGSRPGRMAAGDLEVRGEELSLRYAAPEDAAGAVRAGLRSEVTRYFSWGPYTEESAGAAYIASLRPSGLEGERIEFVIEHPEARADRRDRAVRVRVARPPRRGRHLARQSWWGTGANRGSKALVLALAFRGHRARARDRLVRHRQRPLADGARTTRLRQRGNVCAQWHVHGGVGKDVISYSMLHEEWERSELASEPVEIAGEIPPQFLP